MAVNRTMVASSADDRRDDQRRIERAVEGHGHHDRHGDRDEDGGDEQRRAGGDPLRDPDAEPRDRLGRGPGQRSGLTLGGHQAHRREDRGHDHELRADRGQEVGRGVHRDRLDLLPAFGREVGDDPVVDRAVGGGQGQDRGDDEGGDPGSLAAGPLAEVLADEGVEAQQGRGPGVRGEVRRALRDDRGGVHAACSFESIRRRKTSSRSRWTGLFSVTSRSFVAAKP